MTLAVFFGCTFIAFGPALSLFLFTIARDPLRIIILIAGSVPVPGGGGHRHRDPRTQPGARCCGWYRCGYGAGVGTGTGTGVGMGLGWAPVTVLVLGGVVVPVPVCTAPAPVWAQPWPPLPALL